MRHQKRKTTLGRERGPRRALVRSLAESLILHGKIRTTKAKAKAIRTFIEPLITQARSGTLVKRRLVIQVLYTDGAVHKLMNDIAPRYKTRSGGYTRIKKDKRRMNDAAEMVTIEFV